MRLPTNPEKQEFIRLRLARNARPGGRSRAEARKYYGGIYHRMGAEERTREVEEGLEREGRKKEVAKERSGAVEAGENWRVSLGDGVGESATKLGADGLGRAEEQTDEPSKLQAQEEQSETVPAGLDELPLHTDASSDNTTSNTSGPIDETARPDDGLKIIVHEEVTVTKEVIKDSEAPSAATEQQHTPPAESDEKTTTALLRPNESHAAMVSEEAILLAAVKRSTESDHETFEDEEEQNDSLPHTDTDSAIENDSAAFATPEKDQSEQIENAELPTPPATSPASVEGPREVSAGLEQPSAGFEDEAIKQTISWPEASTPTVDETDGYVAFAEEDKEAPFLSTEEPLSQPSADQEWETDANEEQSSQTNPDTFHQGPAAPKDKSTRQPGFQVPKRDDFVFPPAIGGSEFSSRITGRVSRPKRAPVRPADDQSDISPKTLEDEQAKAKGKKVLYSPEVSDSEEVDEIEDSDDEKKSDDEPEPGDYEREKTPDDDEEDEQSQNQANDEEEEDDDGNDEDFDIDSIDARYANLDSSELDFLPAPLPPPSDNFASNTIDPYDTDVPPPVPSAGEKRKLPHELEGLAPEVAAAFVDYSSSQRMQEDGGSAIVTPEGPPQKRPRLRKPGVKRGAEEDNAAAADVPASATTADGEKPITPQIPGNSASATGGGSRPTFFSSIMNEIGGKP